MTGHDFAGFGTVILCLAFAALMGWFVREAWVHPVDRKLSESEASSIVFLGSGAVISFVAMGVFILALTIGDMT